jgi:EmrB/QacA subfamily drug resistance transporter
MQRTWQVFWIVSAGVFLSSLDLFIVNIAFPDIHADFAGTSLAGLSWILDAYAIVFAALLVPFGRLADRTGRRRAFLGGLALFTLSSALCGIAPSVGTLVAARVLQAAGAALIVPTSLGLLLVEFPAEKRAAAVGLWSAMGAVGAAAGPPIGGLLVQASWRWVFLVAVPVGAAAILAGRRVLREVREAPDAPLPDLIGAGVLAASVGAIVLALVEGPGWGWGSARVLAAFGAGAAGLVVFAFRSARHAAPVVEPDLLALPGFTVANLASVVFFAAFGGLILGAALFLTGVWHYSTLEAGLGLAPGPVMAAVGSVVGGRVVQRAGVRAAAVPGGLIFAASCAWLVLRIDAAPDYAAAYLPGNAVGGFGIGLTIASLSAAIAAAVPPARFATGTGVFAMARQIGIALGVAALVAIVAHPDPAAPAEVFHHAWTAMAGAGLVTAALAATLGRRTYRRPLAADRRRRLLASRVT